jgi:hypothetical protein
MVFAADKISKVRELTLERTSAQAVRPRSPKSRQRRLAHYRSCLVVLEAHLPASPLVKQLAAELAGLQRAGAAAAIA